mgnify:FL=1|tara:strand:- start:85 stop:351 length:267 start_codon:yes stop_codon:yes gene_type:complete
MNRSQKYISDYLNSGIQHYQPSKTPMDITGNFGKDRAFRKELFDHCSRSPHWSKGSIAGRPVFKNVISGYAIIIDFNNGLAAGIAHDY